MYSLGAWASLWHIVGELEELECLGSGLTFVLSFLGAILRGIYIM